MIALSAALGILQAVPQVVAKLPEFKNLWDRIVGTFSGDHDQETLKNAYEIAISDADNAHTQLQDIVRRHSGG